MTKNCFCSKRSLNLAVMRLRSAMMTLLSSEVFRFGTPGFTPSALAQPRPEGARTSCPWCGIGRGQQSVRYGPVLLSLPGIEYTAAKVAVSLSRAHIQLLGRSKGLTVTELGGGAMLVLRLSWPRQVLSPSSPCSGRGA